MLRFPAWKITSILAMTAFALLLIVPSLLSPAHREALISHLPKWVPARAIVLGLDLQGGSHVLLEVDSNSVVKTLSTICVTPFAGCFARRKLRSRAA